MALLRANLVLGLLASAGVASLSATNASAQSLLRRAPEVATNTLGEPDSNAALRETSLYMVEAPKPKTIQVQDKVTIIISESSTSSSKQKLDTKKDASLSAEIKKFPDLAALLDGRLETGAGDLTAVDVAAGQKFKGDGTYERSDRYTDRITATVLDVKPNGVLVIEARRTMVKDKESQTVLLTGEVRREDVTENNTVQSSQLAELTVVVQNEGDVKDTASKGWLTQVFEAVFNF